MPPANQPYQLDYESKPISRPNVIISVACWFGLACLVTGLMLRAIAVFGLRQWNTYIGPDICYAIDAAIVAGTAVLGTDMLLTSAVLTGLCHQQQRRPASWPILAATGAVYAILVFAPDIIDTALCGREGALLGDKLDTTGAWCGWIAFFVVPALAMWWVTRPCPKKTDAS